MSPTPRDYSDFTIEISKPVAAGDEITLNVHVVEEMTAEEAVAVQFSAAELEPMLRALDRRELDSDGMMSLGRTLAAIMLPLSGATNKPTIRELFARRLLSPDDRVRVRLRLPRELAAVPWEYAYIERQGGSGMDGFLALDRRVAFVRQEVFTTIPVTPHKGDLRVVAALASPAGGSLPWLDVDTELKDIEAGLKNLAGVSIVPVPHATFDETLTELPNASIFHFAGHGEFDREMTDVPGTYMGTGSLVFEDRLVDAEQFGVNLRGNDVQLAVLGGCETGRREGVSIWSGIAPALMKVDIPAVVANQYTITDECAIAFSRSFYQALAGGLPVEYAVSAGRIAIYNKDKNSRDWGVPVLYLRGANGLLFSGAADSKTRELAKRTAESDIVVRTKNIKQGALVVGAKLAQMLAGKLAVAVTARNVSGTLIGLKAGKIAGGYVNATVDADDVEDGGMVVGAEIEEIGSYGDASASPPPASPPPASPPPSPAPHRGQRARPPEPMPPPPMPAPSPPPALEVETRASGGAAGPTSTVNIGTNSGTAIGTILNSTINFNSPAKKLPLTEERIRLDVANPTGAVVNVPFLVKVAVRQLTSPTLSDPRLTNVSSAEASIFRTEEDDTVEYRVEVSGEGFKSKPEFYVFRLRPKRDSNPYTFQVTPTQVGTRSLFITAYQQRGASPEVIAQTEINIDVQVEVRPQ